MPWHGAVRGSAGAGSRAWLRCHIPCGPWGTARLGKLLGRWAGCPGCSHPHPLPSSRLAAGGGIRAGWLRRSAPRYPPREGLGPRVSSLPHPKLSPKRPAGSPSQRRQGPSSLRGPPTSQPPPVIAASLPSSQPARDSCTQLIRASLESPRGRAALGHICAGGTIASGTPGRPAPAPGNAGRLVLPSCAHPTARLPPAEKRSVCTAAVPAGGTAPGKTLAGRV